MRVKYYINDKEQKQIFVVVEDDTKDVYKCEFMPLFGEYNVSRQKYPTKQQVHSAVYYIKENYKFLSEEFPNNIYEITARVKALFEKETQYESPVKQQDRYTVFHF